MSMEAALNGLPCRYLQRDDYAGTGSHLLGIVVRDELRDSARFLLDGGFFLEDVSGLDSMEAAVSIYRYGHFTLHGRLTLLCLAPHDNAAFPSIAEVYQGAEWHERETHDFYGFTYPGNPNPIPLLMPETMPDVHPLLKSDGARAALGVLFPTLKSGAEVICAAKGFDLANLITPVETAPSAQPSHSDDGGNADV